MDDNLYHPEHDEPTPPRQPSSAMQLLVNLVVYAIFYTIAIGAVIVVFALVAKAVRWAIWG